MGGVGGVGACKTYGTDPAPAAKKRRRRWQIWGLAEAYGTLLGAELSLSPPINLQGLQIFHCWAG